MTRSDAPLATIKEGAYILNPPRGLLPVISCPKTHSCHQDGCQVLKVLQHLDDLHSGTCRVLHMSHDPGPREGVGTNELALCSRWPKYWSFSFSISPSNEYSSQGASERRGILWRWRGPSGLRWVWRNARARTRSPSPRAWRPDFPGAAREAP